MMPTPHPEVLANEWLPPVALGRQDAVREVVRRLDPPNPHVPPPWLATVSGPSGSGTSTVARRAAREVADRLRAGSGATPRILTVRVAGGRGTHGVVTALLQRLDDGFDGRGFPVREVLAGVLRRLRRDGRATVLVIDDVGIGAPDLSPVLGALAKPDRFLPEGESGLPPIFTIVAGSEEGIRTIGRSLGEAASCGRPVHLTPYSAETLRSVVRDRAERALGHPLPDPVLDTIVERAVADGSGARRAVDLLRHWLLGSSLARSLPTVATGFGLGVPVEPRVVRAIGAASRGVAATLGDVRRLEAELAHSSGERPLPTTTLWRRIVRLEQAGYLRREIRTGGHGGTRSLLRVLTPIEEWVTLGRPLETPRAFAPWAASGPAWVADRGGPPRPPSALLPTDDGPG